MTCEYIGYMGLMCGRVAVPGSRWCRAHMREGKSAEKRGTFVVALIWIGLGLFLAGCIIAAVVIVDAIESGYG